MFSIRKYNYYEQEKGKKTLKRLAFLLILGVAGCHKSTSTTFYLPEAVQGSQPFCLSNRSNADVKIPHGATVQPGQMVRAGVVVDFKWGFSIEPATERQDVDCFVIQ